MLYGYFLRVMEEHIVTICFRSVLVIYIDFSLGYIVLFSILCFLLLGYWVHLTQEICLLLSGVQVLDLP